MPSSHAPRDGRRVVLDSNVWIDILVFDDPATRPIRAALEHGALVALIDTRCLHELERVLDYPQFAPRQIDKAAALATVARLTRLVETAEPDPDEARPLPKCRDRDDQKFLELARAIEADWLVSKDRALLKLSRRTERDFLFRIMQPAPFVAACGLAPAEPAPA
ncbi:putative toxin-antitoxin system toxin component, PIN family [Burkholderia plantarii]|uniref:Nucleic acid-binding protein n=1 Tax=Burkholderia plantarii TaxID=41899 RepID=A0A0B6S4R2_BURPL|nr:putative toxin-antitoxin system toxin component, PIN family [Burkholderia plantarii]AJK47226.1 nucleic acid-binding protein [Burkholderia plantarii]WLE60083.1 putative toxin-antitoxin system toxin component, PIN family [Burkholderia plantarii]